MYLWKEIFFLFWTYYSDQVSLIDIVKVSCVVCLYLLGIWNWSYFFFLILVYMSYAVMWEKKKSRWCNHKKKVLLFSSDPWIDVEEATSTREVHREGEKKVVISVFLFFSVSLPLCLVLSVQKTDFLPQLPDQYYIDINRLANASFFRKYASHGY